MAGTIASIVVTRGRCIRIWNGLNCHDISKDNGVVVETSRANSLLRLLDFKMNRTSHGEHSEN